MRLAVFTLITGIVTGCAGRSTVDSGERGLGPTDTVPAAAKPLDACNDAPLLTVEQLAAGEGDGQRVALDAVPEVNGMCTLLACDSECCNQCGGNYGVALRRKPPERDFELRFDGVGGCGGMDCNFHCEPFGRKPATRYRFVGTNRYKPAGVTSTYHQAEFAVEKFCVLPPSSTPSTPP